jgi:hypothetical protein
MIGLRVFDGRQSSPFASVSGPRHPYQVSAI